MPSVFPLSPQNSLLPSLSVAENSVPAYVADDERVQQVKQALVEAVHKKKAKVRARLTYSVFLCGCLVGFHSFHSMLNCVRASLGSGSEGSCTCIALCGRSVHTPTGRCRTAHTTRHRTWLYVSLFSSPSSALKYCLTFGVRYVTLLKCLTYILHLLPLTCATQRLRQWPPSSRLQSWR